MKQVCYWGTHALWFNNKKPTTLMSDVLNNRPFSSSKTLTLKTRPSAKSENELYLHDKKKSFTQEGFALGLVQNRCLRHLGNGLFMISSKGEKLL